MLENLAQNWPVYLLGGAFIIFVGVALNNSRQVGKEKKEAKAKDINPETTIKIFYIIKDYYPHKNIKRAIL